MSKRLQTAIEFMKAAHRSIDQRRKYTGAPYEVHPLAVMAEAQKITQDESVAIAAALHDTAEDTPVTLDDIREAFGSDIAALVEDLTDVYTHAAFPQFNKKKRNELERQRLATIDPRAKIVKLLDIADNVSDIRVNDAKYAPIYIEEKRLTIPLLRIESDAVNREAYSKAHAACYPAKAL
jgi:(p)ppGpp synthase/HD superfamily hydrolase